MTDEALIAQKTIRSMPRPQRNSLAFLQQWMVDGGNGECVVLLGKDGNLWHDTPVRDLVALHAREYEDPISTWITEKGLFWYHKILGHRLQKVRNHLVCNKNYSLTSFREI